MGLYHEVGNRAADLSQGEHGPVSIREDPQVRPSRNLA